MLVADQQEKFDELVRNAEIELHHGLSEVFKFLFMTWRLTYRRLVMDFKVESRWPQMDE